MTGMPGCPRAVRITTPPLQLETQMKTAHLLAAAVMAAAATLPALAAGRHSGSIPMNQDQMKGGMMHGGSGGMGMMNPEMMKQKQAMMQKHMATMEQHMANIERLLKELVELQKQK
jgi:hypothetical protein